MTSTANPGEWRGRGQSWETIEKDSELYKLCKEVIYPNKDKWLFLYGKTGSGKTHIAVSLYKDALKRERNTRPEQYDFKLEAAIVSNFELLRGVLSDFTGENNLLDYYKSLDCLIIEECEKFWQTSKGNEINILFEIINHYYTYNKQLIFVSNISWNEYLKKLGAEYAEMLTSRFKEMGLSIYFDMPDYRTKIKEAK
jgi:DNA replication protein DnaC